MQNAREKRFPAGSGKTLRDPVVGPSWPEPPQHPGPRIITFPLEVAWMVLLAGWVVYSRLNFVFPVLNDPDSARLAFGVAQRLQGVPFPEGAYYQLPKQFGAYLVFEGLARLFNVQAAGLPHMMAVSCAVFMMAILVIGFSLGQMIWGRKVALLSTTLLSMSPMMWITGEYPTVLVPGLFFFVLAVWAMVMSYRVRGGRLWLIISAVFFAVSTFVSLDMILGCLVPLCYAWFVDRRGLRRALFLYAIWAVLLLVVWFPLMRFTPHEILALSQKHSPDYPKSVMLNWWGMGPFLFVFAFAGFVYRFVSDRRPLPFIFFWILGFNTFYTGHLYSPRYFIPYYLPVSWLAAFSIVAFYGWFARMVSYRILPRMAFMLVVFLGFSTMLTMSVVRGGDGRLRAAFGEVKTFADRHGNYPTGAVWYYMQRARKGEGLRFTWLESSAKMAAERIFQPDSPAFEGGATPVYAGAESKPFIDFELMASGWRFDSVRGQFLTFAREARAGDPLSGKVMLQTVYVAEKPAPELAFLSNPGRLRTLLGRDAIPRLLDAGPTSLGEMSGWKVEWVLDGLDILISSPYHGISDGTIDCERALLESFHTDLFPRWHVELTSSDFHTRGGRVLSHDGQVTASSEGTYLDRVSEVVWKFAADTGRWTAVAVNRIGFPFYEFQRDGETISEEIPLARDLPGRGISRWDVVLVPPEIPGMGAGHREVTMGIRSEMRGAILDLVWVQGD